MMTLPASLERLHGMLAVEKTALSSLQVLQQFTKQLRPSPPLEDF
jgi:hypothetical protein